MGLVRSEGPVEAHQSSNYGCLARFGRRIDFECNALSADCGPIHAASRKRHTSRSKVVKRVVQGFWCPDRQNVMLAALVDARDLDAAPAARQFHKRRRTIECKLRRRLQSRLVPFGFGSSNNQCGAL